MKDKIVKLKERLYDITLGTFLLNALENFGQYAVSKSQGDLRSDIMVDAFNSYFQSVFVEDNSVICLVTHSNLVWAIRPL